MSQEKLFIEAKIKKIDEQIAPLSKLKSQYAGRLHRYHHDKHDIRIYDYIDSRLPILERMFKRRSKTYKLLGYEIKD